ncbi:MAG: DUF1257 domain-containing protein [Planctomycetota bacterium]|jgi:hypothetical protein|nr:DUF1257 domain-containing protein [Planctomycetota bacterium]
MSVIITTVVIIPEMVALSGFLSAAVTAAAIGLELEIEEKIRGDGKRAENSVELCLNNAHEVTGVAAGGDGMAFRGDGVTLIFFRDASGQGAVRVTGEKCEEELRVLGEKFAGRIVQQYAYHRIVNEMRERNMNIVEEETAEDGTVRLVVRVQR